MTALLPFMSNTGVPRRWAVHGKVPNLVLIVSVEEAFLHCPKCIIRSKLWEPDEWPDRTNVPTVAEGTVVHCALSESVAEMQTIIDHDVATVFIERLAASGQNRRRPVSAQGLITGNFTKNLAILKCLSA